MTKLQSSPATLDEPPGETIYNRVFWLSYAANLSLVTANALTFRFAELVAWLGGSEQDAGTIVSTGVIAALAGRLVLGQAIDRFGTRRLWMLTAALFTTGGLLFLAASKISAVIYAARVLFAVGLGGMFTCSIVHVQNHVPPERRTEALGILGSSGFLGMILGSQIGDAILQHMPAGRGQFVALFGGAAALGVVYLALVFVATRNDEHEPPHETPAIYKLAFRYWPGTVVLVAMMMGISFNVITVFLTRFSTHRGLPGIGTFFTAYCISAFTFRVLASRWSKIIGRPRMILMGLTGQCLGMLLLPTVTRDWHFIGPAAASGFGHALLFPAVVSLGSGAFPRQYRGTGTTVVIGFMEIGQMISAPVLGGIIVYFGGAGFREMFWTAAGAAAAIALIFGLTSLRHADDDLAVDDRQPARDSAAERTSSESPVPEDESIGVPFPQIGRNV